MNDDDDVEVQEASKAKFRSCLLLTAINPIEKQF